MPRQDGSSHCGPGSTARSYVLKELNSLRASVSPADVVGADCIQPAPSLWGRCTLKGNRQLRCRSELSNSRDAKGNTESPFVCRRRIECTGNLTVRNSIKQKSPVKAGGETILLCLGERGVGDNGLVSGSGS